MRILLNPRNNYLRILFIIDRKQNQQPHRRSKRYKRSIPNNNLYYQHVPNYSSGLPTHYQWIPAKKWTDVKNQYKRQMKKRSAENRMQWNHYFQPQHRNNRHELQWKNLRMRNFDLKDKNRLSKMLARIRRSKSVGQEFYYNNNWVPVKPRVSFPRFYNR
jgi:uncharacterized protein (UPF0128 family)